MDDIKYPSRESAIEVNVLLGYSGALRDSGMLDSALYAPKMAAHYEESDLIDQVAILMERVALNHPFVDGNKRTAYILGSSMLLINGYTLIFENEDDELEYAQIIEQVVTRKDIDSLVQWIEDHVQPLEEE
jgi:death on curing protein